ncbi:hypothetical protein [Evansella clarkii]|uniref:hypothetical protein n=1 Tax=Evansella clarkii TaxID=79879 RepID=UPI0009960815|nr:hypothetical protein [Evansella clarkii]
MIETDLKHQILPKGAGEWLMLESNTDRSYFMIGAVIVAAILIAGVTFLFRDVLFGESGYLFTLVDNLFNNASGVVDSVDGSTGID